MKLPSLFYKKQMKWIAAAIALGICVVYLWPASVSRTDIFIPVAPVNIPEGLILSPPIPKGIELRVSGPSSVIKSLKDHALTYTLDLSHSGVGDGQIPVREDIIALPANVTIEKVTPSFLSVSIEPESLKIVPIKVSLSGKPAAGFRVAKVTVSPAAVTLKGPKSLLDPITDIQTKPVEINGAVESFKKETTLHLAEGISPSGPLEVILVELTIQQKMDTRNISDIRIKGLHSPYPYQISPDRIEIKVKGPENELDKLNAGESIDVHIDLKDLQPGIYMKPATILLPVGITLIQVEPEIFTVEILKKSSANE